MEYRTQEQFIEMIDNMINGNWSRATENAVEYGIYASDIQNYIDSEPELLPDELSDFMYVTEEASEMRAKL